MILAARLHLVAGDTGEALTRAGEVADVAAERAETTGTARRPARARPGAGTTRTGRRRGAGRTRTSTGSPRSPPSRRGGWRPTWPPTPGLIMGWRWRRQPAVRLLDARRRAPADLERAAARGSADARHQLEHLGPERLAASRRPPSAASRTSALRASSASPVDERPRMRQPEPVAHDQLGGVQPDVDRLAPDRPRPPALPRGPGLRSARRCRSPPSARVRRRTSRAATSRSPGSVSSTASLAAERSLPNTDARITPPGRVTRPSSRRAAAWSGTWLSTNAADDHVEAARPERQPGDVGRDRRGRVRRGGARSMSGSRSTETTDAPSSAQLVAGGARAGAGVQRARAGQLAAEPGHEVPGERDVGERRVGGPRPARRRGRRRGPGPLTRATAHRPRRPPSTRPARPRRRPPSPRRSSPSCRAGRARADGPTSRRSRPRATRAPRR